MNGPIPDQCLVVNILKLNQWRFESPWFTTLSSNTRATREFYVIRRGISVSGLIYGTCLTCTTEELMSDFIQHISILIRWMRATRSHFKPILVLHGTRDWLRDLQFVRGEEFILSDVAIDRSSVTYDQAPLNGIIINGFARQAAQLDRSFHGHSFTEEYHKNSIAHLQQSR